MNEQLFKMLGEFPCGTVGYGSGVVTATALVPDVLQFQSLAQGLVHATGIAKKNF